MKCRDADNNVAYYELAKYTAKDVDIYQGSSEYQDELFEKSNSFGRSYAHILCQFHQYIPDKMLMFRAYKGSYMDPEFRSGCEFVPYTEGELQEIADSDMKAGRHWSPPPQTLPTLAEMCERANRTGTAEQPVTGVLVSTELVPFVGSYSVKVGQTSTEEPPIRVIVRAFINKRVFLQVF